MIKENIQRIKGEISNSARKSGRNPEDIRLVAVSKRFPATKILEAIQAKHLLFGENYIQEVKEKRPLIPAPARFHFIGHLQTNKAKIAAESCDMIETVDRFKLANALNKHLQKIDKKLEILVQVNIGRDPGKSGIPPENTEDLILQLQQLKNIEICGLMTIPPFESDPEASRYHFRKMRELLEELIAKGLFQERKQPELSMGMSNDYQIAIEEGATIVRVGTAIFGNRPAL